MNLVNGLYFSVYINTGSLLTTLHNVLTQKTGVLLFTLSQKSRYYTDCFLEQSFISFFNIKFDYRRLKSGIIKLIFYTLDYFFNL